MSCCQFIDDVCWVLGVEYWVLMNSVYDLLAT